MTYRRILETARALGPVVEEPKKISIHLVARTVDSRGTVRVDFAEVPVAGGTLRMPVGGPFTMRPSRTNPARRTEGKVTLTYSGFDEVSRR